MPTFDFTAPDGKSYSVDGPEGATPAQAFQMLQQHLGSEPQVGAVEDAAKSVGSGLASATAHTIGGLGDLRSGLSAATDWAGGKLGVSPDKVQSFKDLASGAAGMTGMGQVMANAPTTRQVIDFAENPIVSPDYKPKTTLGDYLKTGAEFAPNMLMGGPEGAIARLLTNVVAPTVGEKIGGKLAEGTAAEPYMKAAGAIVGGAGGMSAARAFQEMAAARKATQAIPSAEELLKSGSSGFEAVKSSDAVIKPSSVQQMAKDIKTELLNDGKHPTSEGQAGIFNALDRLETMGQSNGVTTKDMEVIRKNLSDARMTMNPAAASAARDATKSFMEKYSNLAAGDLLHGSNPFPTLKTAIADYAAGKRSNTVMGKVALGNLNAETAGAGANTDNALRQSIKQLVRPINNDIVPKAARLGFNSAEIDAMNTAARGTTFGNAARYLGKAAPTGIVSGALSSSAGHMAGGPLGAVALPAAGFIAKKIGDLSTKRAVAAVDSLVRSRSPLAAQVASQLSPQIIQQMPAKTQRILQGLIFADQQLTKQSSQTVGQPVGQPNTN